MLIASADFTDDDEPDLEPIKFELKWRSKTDPAKTDVETFECFPEVPFGILLDVEGGVPRAGYELLDKALRDDDHKLDRKKEIVPGSSSRERYQDLTHDRSKRLPPEAISVALQGLYVEYTMRRNPTAAAARPTQPSVRSSAPRSATGRTSTGKPRGKASTSAASRLTVA